MQFHQDGSIRYLQFDILSGIKHAIVTRQGGVSQEQWRSLNLGGTVGDDPLNVEKNKSILYQALQLDSASIYDVWQVHGDNVVATDKPRPREEAHIQADAILTNRPDVTLMMRFADCVPIFLWDPIKRVIGTVHAGWKGTVMKTGERAVQKMVSFYGTKPDDILAAIGPSIGAHHYQVGREVVEQVRSAFPGDEYRLLFPSPEKTNPGVQFDLWEANRLVLNKAGVSRIEIAGICTACHPDDWFSHRRDNGKTGRFATIIRLDHK